MAKRKRTKGQTTIYYRIHRKLKIEQTNTTKVLRKDKQFALYQWHVNLETNPVVSHERANDQEVRTTSGTYSWSFLTQIFRNG